MSKLELTAEERDYLLELLDANFKDTMREENRADAIWLRNELKETIALIDGLRDKIRNADVIIEVKVKEQAV